MIIGHIDTTHPNTGYCAVAQGDIEAAAGEVCRQLSDMGERLSLGALARKDYERFLHIDQRKLYLKAIDIAAHPERHHVETPPPCVPDILRMLFEHIDARFRDWKSRFEAMTESQFPH